MVTVSGSVMLAGARLTSLWYLTTGIELLVVRVGVRLWVSRMSCLRILLKLIELFGLAVKTLRIAVTVVIWCLVLISVECVLGRLI